jgi:ubiquinone/menaquinone biosynthesis C-methylase UbiE
MEYGGEKISGSDTKYKKINCIQMSIQKDTERDSERIALYEFILKTLKAGVYKEIADIASGTGEGAATLAAGKSESKVIGVDLDKELVERSTQAFPMQNLSFVVADARRIPLSDQSIDAIVSAHTIEHIERGQQWGFVKELYRILKPGGIAIIATPDRQVWEWQGIAGMHEGHVGEITKEELIEVIQMAGFTNVRVYGQRVVHSSKNQGVRSLLNILKKADIFKLRRLFKKTVDFIDKKTQPASLDVNVVLLEENQKASVNIVVCKK